VFILSKGSQKILFVQQIKRAMHSSVKVISLLGDLLAANLTALDHIKEEPSIE
jgi:hypothetical protein